MRSIYLVFAVLAGLGLAGCAEQDGDEHHRGASGKELFETYCARCHGTGGEGNFLMGVPANRDTRLRKEEIVRLLQKGMAIHPRMKKFPKLGRRDALALAEYLGQLKEKAGQGPFWEVPPVPGRP